MIPCVPVLLRALAAASLVVLALAACGRRGPLEAPPDAAAAAAQRQREEVRLQRQGGSAAATPTGAAVAGQTEIPAVAQARRSEGTPPEPDEDDADELPSNIAPTPIPTPQSGGRKRGVTIPKEPFALDPLL
ncbi:MAG TPA: lipoprotein [Beijerinckiaceae bacterium]|jgi:predicted small lipoprotein YifL